MSARVSSVAARVAFALALAVPMAHADTPDETKVECAEQAQEAQRLKLGGRLQDALVQLRKCAREACPPIVRTDCLEWIHDVDVALPTIVLGARDADGRDLLAVRVLIDGKLASERLDGRAIALDPGIHLLRFEARDAAPIEQELVVRRGEKDRSVSATFGTVPPLPTESSPGRAKADSASALPSTLAWVLGGTGAVALGTSLALYVGVRSDFDHLQQSCGSRCSESDVSPLRTRYTLSQVTLGVGVVALAAAVYVFLTTRPGVSADVPRRGAR